MTNYENRVQTSDDMNWTPDQLRNYMTRRLASEQRSREKMQAEAAQTVCPWCNRPVEKVSEKAGAQIWYFYRHAPGAPKCQGMWTVMEEKS